MKRKLQRILSAAVAMLLAVGMLGTTVSAETNKALCPEKGTLTIHKYLMDNQGIPGEPNTGKPIDAGDLPTGATALSGIRFKIEKLALVFDANGNVVNTAGTPVGTIPTKASEVVRPDMIDSTFAEYIVTTGADGTVTTMDLDRGMYLVTELSDPRVSSPAAPFLVSVPMTDPDVLNEWITDVHVYPKNESLSVDKSIGVGGNDHAGFNTKDSFPWLIDVTIPTTISVADDEDAAIAALDNQISFVIKDKLDPRLQYVTPPAADNDENTALAAPTLYAIESMNNTSNGTAIPNAGNVNYTVDFDSATNTLKVTLTAAGRAYLKANNISYLRLVFFTKLAETADMNTPIYNDGAAIEYKNQYLDEPQIFEVPEDKRPEAHTGSIGIVKVDANNSSVKLEGAEFKIAASLADAKNGIFLKGRDGQDLLAVSDATGLAVFRGLAYGDNTLNQAWNDSAITTTYYIVETKAPEGYNLLNEPHEVSVNFVMDENDDSKIAYIAKVDVKNSEGFTLPETGDNMALLLTIAGVLISGAAILYLVLSKKKRNA